MLTPVKVIHGNTVLGGVATVNGHEGHVDLAAADVGAIPAADIGKPGGVASLGSDGLVPASQLPPMTPPDTQDATLADAALALSPGRTIGPVDLTSAAGPVFDGTAGIVPGVTGILPAAKGGTGNQLGAVQSPNGTVTGIVYVPVMPPDPDPTTMYAVPID